MMKASARNIFKNLRETAKPYDHLFCFSLLFMFLSSIANILPSWLIKVSVDGISALGSKTANFPLLPKQVENFLLKNYPEGFNIYFLGWQSNISARSLSEALYLSTADFINLLPIGIVLVFSVDAVFKLAYIFSIRSWA